ncbi:hypothetical protein [Kitasatospora sp. GP82]|uniref:SCO2583/SCO2584 N-terminal domain-containing protein n=1 Tax=Kitasatospora sp. GP82 TaxID=3035089 RepID=UPI002474175C|nr:hypothetical protein [Kitasatospora sp. GP82]
MPTVDDPHPHPEDEPPRGDPFENLVLDEEFVRSATVKEQSGRARMLAAKWLREPPEPPWPQAPAQRPQGRRGRLRGLRARIGTRWQTWLIVVVVIALVLLSLQLATGSKPAPPAPVIQPTRTVTPDGPAEPLPPSQQPDSPVARPVLWNARG